MVQPLEMTGIAALVGFDPMDSEFRRDPYPQYKLLRDENPFFKSPLGFWMLTRYRDCFSVLQDDRFAYPDGEKAKATDLIAAGYSSQRNFMFFMNPPDHTRMRTIVREGLSPKVVHNLRVYVQAAANRLLDEAFESKQEFDLISSFAHSQPFGVICELLDVPDQDRALVMKMAQDYLAGIGPAFSISQAQHKARDEALVELNDYFRSLSDERRRKPGEDLLSHLIDAKDHDRMSADELFGTCVLMFVAGHSTTTNLIGNGTVALLSNPDQLARFRSEPDLEGSAIEEILRFDVPTHQSFRIATEDVALDDDHVVREGEQVLAIRGAANRDPEMFSEPDRLDLGRQDNRHLSFGTGRHICIGSALARMQGKVALRTLFDRAPGLTLTVSPDELEYQESMLVRGLKVLPVVADPSMKRSGGTRVVAPEPVVEEEVEPGVDQPYGAAYGRVNTELEKENVALVERFNEEVLLALTPKKAPDFLRPDFVQNHPLFGEGEGLTTWFAGFFANFSDLTLDCDVTFAQNNRVLCMLHWRARHSETGDKFVWRTCHIYRVIGGKLSEHWALIDYSALEPYGVQAPPHQHQPVTPIDWFGSDTQKKNLRLFVDFANDMFAERKKEDAGLYLREDFVNNDPMAKLGDQEMSGNGIEGFQHCFIWYDMVPNMTFTFDHILSGENHVGGFWSSYGEMAGGGKFLLHTVDMYRIHEGKIAEHWTLWDFSQLKQFGMTPPDE